MTTNLKNATKTVDLARYAGGNPFYIDAGTSIVTSAGDGIYGDDSASWTITNAGNVRGAVDGIDLRHGGEVTNKDSGAVIAGSSYGVFIHLGSARVTNAGTISGGAGIGVGIVAGGTVTNAGTASKIEGSDAGIDFSGGRGSVTNAGIILASTGYGIVVNDGGTATNLAGARITGGEFGIYIHGGKTTNAVYNSGVVIATGQGKANASGVDPAGVSAEFVTNTTGGIIEGFAAGVWTSSVYNQGRIEGTGSAGIGVYSRENMFNTASGVITGVAYGVKMPDPPSVAGVVNQGLIEGTGSAGVGIFIAAPYVGDAQYPPSGTLTNSGKITGNKLGVYIGGGMYAGLLNNFGTIEGTGTSAIGVKMPIGIVNNYSGGIINGGAIGVDITGIYDSPFGDPASLVENGGLIRATGSKGIGIEVTGGGPGQQVDSATILNIGTIIGGSSGKAVEFGYSDGRLIVGADAVFVGTVDGGTGTSVLELAEGKTPGDLKGDFIRFKGMIVDPGATWSLDGSENGLLSRTEVTVDGTLSLDAGAVLTANVVGDGTLALGDGDVAIDAGTKLSVANWSVRGTGAELNENLTYSGALKIAAGSSLAIGAGHRLTLVGNTDIAGTISGAGSLAFSYVYPHPSTVTFDAGAAITAASWSFSGKTTLIVDEVLSFDGAFGEGSTPTVVVDGGDSLRLTGASTFAGTVSGAGTLAFTGGSQAIDAGAALSVADWSLSGGARTTLNETLVYAGAFSDAAGTSLAVAADKTLTLDGAVSGAGTISIGANATLDAGGRVGGSQIIAYGGANAALEIADPTGFAGKLSGFRSGDYLDIDSNAFAYSASETVGFVENHAGTQGTLTLTNGSNTMKIILFGQYSAAGFHLGAGDSGGTLIAYDPAAATTPRVVTGHG